MASGLASVVGVGSVVGLGEFILPMADVRRPTTGNVVDGFVAPLEAAELVVDPVEVLAGLLLMDNWLLVETPAKVAFDDGSVELPVGIPIAAVVDGVGLAELGADTPPEAVLDVSPMDVWAEGCSKELTMPPTELVD